MDKKDIKPDGKNVMDGLDLMSYLKDNDIACAFFDPQYRGILDKMNYGNEGKSRGKERCRLKQMDNDLIHKFIRELCRVLKPSAYLFLWTDKFHLCEGIKQWVAGTDFTTVDLIVWNKLKMGMGYRSRSQCEFLLVLQKSPKTTKNWKTKNLRDIQDVYEEKADRSEFPHRKPVELQRALIEAVTEEGDLVLDPAAGSYSVLEAVRACNRIFLGCDIAEEDALLPTE